MKQLTEYQARVLVMYLGENWTNFVAAAESLGMSEDEADELYIALGGED